MGEFISLLVAIILVVAFAIAWMRIFSKAGYPAWCGLLMLVPPINVILILYFGFAEWPIHRKDTIIDPDKEDKEKKEFKKKSNFPSDFS